VEETGGGTKLKEGVTIVDRPWGRGVIISGEKDFCGEKIVLGRGGVLVGWVCDPWTKKRRGQGGE